MAFVKQTQYSLRAMVHHHGRTVVGGHYTAVTLSDTQWIYVDDSQVKRPISYF